MAGSRDATTEQYFSTDRLTAFSTFERSTLFPRTRNTARMCVKGEGVASFFRSPSTSISSARVEFHAGFLENVHHVDAGAASQRHKQNLHGPEPAFIPADGFGSADGKRIAVFRILGFEMEVRGSLELNLHNEKSPDSCFDGLGTSEVNPLTLSLSKGSRYYTNAVMNSSVVLNFSKACSAAGIWFASVRLAR